MIFPRLDGFVLHGDAPATDRTKYLIGNFIPMKGVGLLVGEPTVGKTFLAIGMAASTASGSWFLGQYVPASGQLGTRPRLIEGGSTLFIVGEGLSDIAPRLDAAYQGLGDAYRQRLADLGCTGHLPVYQLYRQGLRDDTAFERFHEEVKELAAQLELLAPNFPLRLIVIDTGPAVFSFRDENSAAEIQGMFCKLVRLSEATGAVVVVTMHPAKHRRAGTVRGSGVFEGSADFILTATRANNGSRKITVSKSRSNAAEGESWGYRIVSLTLSSGDPSAYVDGPSRTLVPPPPPCQEAEGGKMTRDAMDVLAAIRMAVGNAPVTWLSSEGNTIVGADKKGIQAALVTIKASASVDARAKSYARGIKWLLQEAVIDQHDLENDGTAYVVRVDTSIGKHANEAE